MRHVPSPPARGAVALLAVPLLAGCSILTSLDDLGAGGTSSGAATASTGSGGGQGVTATATGTTGGSSTTGTQASSGAAGGSQTYAAEVLADGPIGYWRLGDPRIPTAADASPNGHDGTYVGGVTLGVAGALANDPDTAALFNGTTGFVSVADPPEFTFGGTQPFSLEAWVNPSTQALDSTLTVCARFASPPATDGYWLFESNLGLYAKRWGGGSSATVTAPLLEAGVFSHVVVTYDGMTLRLYVNGGPPVEDAAPTPMAPDAVPFVIGANSGGNDDQFAGTLDEVAVYDKVLMGSRINAHFAAAKMP